MQLVTALKIALLLSPTTLAAQYATATMETVPQPGLNQYHPQKLTPAQIQSLSTIYTASFVPPCPVPIRAQQGGSESLVRAQDDHRASVIAQRITLFLTTLKPARITAARVTVHGLTGKGRIVQAEAASDPAAEQTRTLNVSFAEDSGKESAADLLLHGFTSVRSIDLESVTYSDGSTWSLSGSSGCRVAPDPVMRIARR